MYVNQWADKDTYRPALTWLVFLITSQPVLSAMPRAKLSTETAVVVICGQCVWRGQLLKGLGKWESPFGLLSPGSSDTVSSIDTIIMATFHTYTYMNVSWLPFCDCLHGKGHYQLSQGDRSLKGVLFSQPHKQTWLATHHGLSCRQLCFSAQRLSWEWRGILGSFQVHSHLVTPGIKP